MNVHNPNNLPVMPIADILPTQGDLKDLSEKNYAKLKKVIEHRGFSYPVYVWENEQGVKHLLDGHQRQRVLKSEGWNEPIPYLKVPAENLQEAMARLLEITSQYATITQEGIDEFIAKYELPEQEVFEATSFDALSSFGNEPEPEVEEDEAPEVSIEPAVSKLGEIYQLGRHFVMCGDSTDKASVELLMDGGKPDFILTDPPYGIGISSNPVRQKHEKSNWDDNPITSEAIRELLTYSGSAVIWGGNYFDLPASKGFVIWDKKQPEDFSLAMCEMAWSSIDKPAKIYRESVTSYQKDHPTQKPVGLMAWCMKIYEAGNNVMDLYLGSGSTLIACEQTDRTCYGMELDPKYVDVIRKRYAKFVNNNELPENWEELTPMIRG